MKIGYLVLAACIATGCSSIPSVYKSSSNYPRLSSDEYQRISATLDSSKQTGRLSNSDYLSSKQLLNATMNGKPLSENQINQLAKLKSAVAKQREEERKAQEQRRQEMLNKKRQDEEVAKRGVYNSDFDSISTPEEASLFIKKYDGVYDPDNLVQLAKKRGFDRDIQKQKECIDANGKVIAKQQKASYQTGAFDKSALYYATANQMVCKKRLMTLLTECSKSKICR